MTLANMMSTLRDWYVPADPEKRRMRFDALMFTAPLTRGNLLHAFSHITLVSILGLNWKPWPVVLAWAAVASLLVVLARVVLRPFARSFESADAYASCNALCAGASAIFISAFASSAIIFWVPGDAVNHMTMLLVLIASFVIGIAQSGAHPPLGVVSFLYLVVAFVMCAIEGSRLTLTMALFAPVIGHMLAGVMNRAASGTNALIKLRYAERDNVMKQTELVSRLRESDRTKARFLAHISHELRTPLNAIIGFSDMMRLEILGPLGNESYASYVNDINNSGTHLLSIVDDLLDMSKIEAGKVELHETEFDLRKIACEAEGMLLLKAKKGAVTLINNLPPGIMLSADETATRQVLLNLMNNAVKFTPADGTVWLNARFQNGSFVVTVEDTGCGIAPEDLAHVFEPFGRGRHDIAVAERGTGLGLPIVRSMMRAHGGDAMIESVLGSGTTVTLTWPGSRAKVMRKAA